MANTPHSTPPLDERLIRYLQEKDPQAIDRIIEAYWPTVMSVCRRYHADPHEAEDAAQETFLRLLRHAPKIRSHLGAWLKTTARSVCVDHIRKAVRHRELLQKHPGLLDPPDPSPASRHRVQSKLDEALQNIDEPLRELLLERYHRYTPLRVLAGKSRTSLSTVHRQLQRGLDQTADVLKDMGIEEIEDLTRQALVDQIVNDPMRHAPQWPQAPTRGDESAPLTFPGWSRPIRVGTLISHHAQITECTNGPFVPKEDEAAFFMRFVADPRFELISIIDPGTDNVGMVERVIRDYAFCDGLIDGTDLECLKTLDVIVVGLSFSQREDVLHNIRLAVEAGVGFFNDGFLGTNHLGPGHPDVMALSLCATPTMSYCPYVEIRGQPCPGGQENNHNGQITVLVDHPATPSWFAGKTFRCGECGPRFTPVADATLIAQREQTQFGDMACKTPYLVGGHCGRGRVLYLNTVHGYRHVPEWTPGLTWVSDALQWLAEPRRESLG
ncbi:RNA polymerase sigma factor [Algisphaera agarilytica]|uniref:RNA polymerase sigma factor (Sigma-70 family) n=1 Tax=Algisphaera agarilytica TaxID=1385975 RepID=A0A7X0H5N6_9BACT|nr:sigma-70 family RNA polymerase sigma factor [Algisphaera agarilytica]MBB6429598.1 RNA polymerase sigma factor (sigma-70 family) [Algisphaera agarilytica]